MNTDEQSNAAADICAETPSRVDEAREWVARGKRVFRPDIVSDLCNEIDALREAERRIRARITAPVFDAELQMFARQLLLMADWVDPNKNPMPKDVTWSNLATRLRTIADALAAAPSVSRQPSCGICGGKMVEIRERYPKMKHRAVCPQCLAERMDIIQETASSDYGKAFTESPLPTPPDLKEQTE